MTVFIGDLVIHTNAIDERPFVFGHKHARDHVTSCIDGWFMLMALDGPEADVPVQLAQRSYLPNPRMRWPYRLPDLIDPRRGRRLDIGWFAEGDEIPLGAKRIDFAPVGHRWLIRAGIAHSIHTLSRDPVGTYECTFTRVEGDDQFGPYR